MTPGSYRVLVVVLGLVAGLGAWIAAPTPGELGLLQELGCSKLVAEPQATESVEVRFRGCEVSVDRGSVRVGRHIWRDADPELLEYARRTRLMTPAQRARWTERHPDAVPRLGREIEARVVDRSDDPDFGVELHRVGPPRPQRAAGITLSVLALLGLLLVVRAQRRWRDQGGAGRRPVSF